MSTSRCGNICVIPPKCSRKERRSAFSNRSSVKAAVSGRRCVCVCERERERERQSHHSGVSYLNRGLCANIYKLHHCVCHTTLFPFRAWTDGKTKDIINCIYIYFERWSSRLWGITFTTPLVVFGQWQCTVPVGQSEQTALVGRRGFVENEAFERGGA